MDAKRTRTRTRTRKQTEVSAEEKVVVYSTYVGEESSNQETLEIKKFVTDPAYIRVNAGMTKNMGNYESLRLDVALTVPCYLEEIDDVFDQVADRAAMFLSKELEKYE